jgi:hypothetical protein
MDIIAALCSRGVGHIYLAEAANLGVKTGVAADKGRFATLSFVPGTRCQGKHSVATARAFLGNHSGDLRVGVDDGSLVANDNVELASKSAVELFP